jgi:hypothetical protein
MTMPMTSSSTSGAGAKPQRHPLAHLPGDDGWPIVGNTFAALKNPVGHVEVMHRKHGPVYRDHLFGVRHVAMLGPEANELLCSTTIKTSPHPKVGVSCSTACSRVD